MEIITNYTGGPSTPYWVTRTFWRRADLTNPTSSDVGAAAYAMHLLFGTAVNAYTATGLTAVCGGATRIIDEASGVMEAEIAGATYSSGAGTDANGFVSGVGARLRFTTQNILKGRHVSGSLWLGPLPNDCFTDGNVNSAFQGAVATDYTAMQNYAEANAVVLCVYTRPPKDTLSGGVSSAVTGGAVSSLPSLLARRRV